MNIQKTIINLREQNNMSQVELSELMDLNKNVMGRIEREERPLRDNEILKLAEIFNVSTDLILGKQISSSKNGEERYWSFVEKTERDVAKQLKKIIKHLDTETDLYFYGESITTEERKLLASILEVGLRVVKEKHDNDRE